jgi:hypothetical protein
VVRGRRAAASGGTATRLGGLALVALAVTAAGGLGLLVGGARPRELLHFVYAAIAFAALPLAGSFSARLPDQRRWLATVIGAVIALVAILRLFATG